MIRFIIVRTIVSGREMLTLMARVRGVRWSQVTEEVDKWTQFLGIQEYIERSSEEL